MTSYNTADLAQIKNIECFLLDMDGTIYLGDTVIDGTFDFLDILKKLNKNVYGVSPIYNELNGETIYPNLSSIDNQIDVYNKGEEMIEFD
mgnify:CR=1 FL=1